MLDQDAIAQALTRLGYSPAPAEDSAPLLPGQFAARTGRAFWSVEISVSPTRTVIASPPLLYSYDIADSFRDYVEDLASVLRHVPRFS